MICCANKFDLNSLIQNELKLFLADSFFKYQVETTVELSPIARIHGSYAHFSQCLGNHQIRESLEQSIDFLLERTRTRTRVCAPSDRNVPR